MIWKSALENEQLISGLKTHSETQVSSSELWDKAVSLCSDVTPSTTNLLRLGLNSKSCWHVRFLLTVWLSVRDPG